jgi:hypothetical protein
MSSGHSMLARRYMVRSGFPGDDREMPLLYKFMTGVKGQSKTSLLINLVYVFVELGYMQRISCVRHVVEQ